MKNYPETISALAARGAFRRRGWERLIQAAACSLLLAGTAAPARAQASQPAASAAQDAGQKPAATTAVAGEQTPLPGDWAPELLYGIWNSPNPQAAQELYRAAFAAGPAIIPQLQAALKDDRTATFAAQSLALIGGSEAMKILATLVNDKRNLDLRQFYYGALAETDDVQSRNTLLEVVRNADSEPDRQVTQQAILALSTRSDLSVAEALRQAEKQVNDPVIGDDIESAISVISARARYLAERKVAGTSMPLERAVRAYFIAALNPALSMPPRAAGATRPHFPHVEVKIQSLTFSPDHSRALAHVFFEDPAALAEYDIVLQKKFDSWTVASVWLGPEHERERAHPQAPKQGAKRGGKLSQKP